MSGKQHKKERKAAREAERRAAAKAERQRNLMTVIVVLVVVALGGVLVWLTLAEEQEAADQDLEEMLEELEDRAEQAADEESEGEDEADGEGEDVSAAEPCDPAPAPPTAGETKPTFDEPEQVLEEGMDYRAVIATSCGDVVIDLDEERAPEAVNSFVFLAQQGFFDGLEIFRNATSISALQTGAGDNDARWQIGYSLPDELESAEEEGYPPGSVAMANSGQDTSGSQFFFVYGDFGLEPTYTKFAQTVEGLDVLRSIGAIEVDGETPQETVYMESVTIETE